jgi:roadblock/LC7 domain-containing protein
MSIPAGKFLSDGKLVDYPGRQELPPDMLDLTAQFAAAVSQMLAVPGVAHTKISGLKLDTGRKDGSIQAVI